MLKNSAGSIFYGMHFYPGVAEYREDGKEPKRIFIDEDTIRTLDPTFAGCPVFVQHVDALPETTQDLKSKACGWVVESFFNQADGKHWAKFIIIGDEALEVIKKGWRLSNSYLPEIKPEDGEWNGVEYHERVTGGKFEHLAIVENPRYDESIILTPEQFKKYNEDQNRRLKEISNSKQKKENSTMAVFKFWEKKPVEKNDLSNLTVTLPKSGKEKTLTQIINEADEKEEAKESNMAHPDSQVKLLDGSTCKLSQMLEEHKSMKQELEELKKGKEEEDKKENKDEESEDKKENVEVKDVEAKKENLGAEEDEKALAITKEIEELQAAILAKTKELASHEKAELQASPVPNKKMNAKKNIEVIMNAGLQPVTEVVEVYDSPMMQFKRGLERY